ncbi:hypothetical protein BBP40_004009 [Aspergillus hancockii]|nr:hypothetical protein BBP40_004009 [Aspergillus hancockii]
MSLPARGTWVDDTSSIYSRLPDCPKFGCLPTSIRPRPTPDHDLPEINSLDHAIALARGSTMALETTRTRLQSVKTVRRLPLRELREEKLQQWELQEYENRFYHTCLDIFCDLAAVAINVSQGLVLQHHFEPEVNPVGNDRLLLAVHELRTALEESREREARAEFEWKGRWNVPRVGAPSTRWI